MGHSEVGTDLFWATPSIQKNFAGLQSGVDRILLGKIRFETNLKKKKKIALKLDHSWFRILQATV